MSNSNQKRDNAENQGFFGNSFKGSNTGITPQMDAQIRKIIKEEIQRNSKSGAPVVPPHTHNGKDNLKIPLLNIVGADILPSSNTKFSTPFLDNDYGFASPQRLGGLQIILNNYVTQAGVPLSNTSNNLSATVPIPVIFSDDGLTFNGGNADIGTMVMFQTADGVTNQLWVMGIDGWWGVNLPLIG